MAANESPSDSCRYHCNYTKSKWVSDVNQFAGFKLMKGELAVIFEKGVDPERIVVTSIFLL